VELLSQPFEEAGKDSSVSNAVTGTWMVTFENTRKRYRGASNLLSVMSIFGWERIPKLLLYAVARNATIQIFHQDRFLKSERL
jgi:hypothetical protein